MGPVLLIMAWLGSAWALDVERRTDGEAVLVTAELPHSIDAVRALLSDDAVTMRLGKDIREVEVAPLDNGCVQLTVTNIGFRRELKYVSERCVSPDGWHSKMLSSDDFLKHDIQWSIRPSGEHTSVSIRVVVQLKTIIPRWMVDRFVGRALESTLKTMDEMLTQQRLEN